MGDGGAMMMGVSSLVGAYSQSQAVTAQAKYAEHQAESNSRLAEAEAKDAIARGEKEAQAVKKKANLMQGSQRAAMAASGVDLSSGSASDILKETGTMGAEDALTVKNNAYKQAWGIRTDAMNKKYEAQMASVGAAYEARSTLLTGGLQAAAYGFESYGKREVKNSKKQDTSGKKISGSSYKNTSNVS